MEIATSPITNSSYRQLCYIPHHHARLCLTGGVVPVDGDELDLELLRRGHGRRGEERRGERDLRPRRPRREVLRRVRQLQRDKLLREAHLMQRKRIGLTVNKKTPYRN